VWTKAEEHVVKIEKEYCKENWIGRSVIEPDSSFLFSRFSLLVDWCFTKAMSFSILFNFSLFIVLKSDLYLHSLFCYWYQKSIIWKNKTKKDPSS
jgi:hypothetical protein